MNIIFQKLLKLFHILQRSLTSVQCLMGFKYAVYPSDWFLNGTLIGFIGHFLLYIVCRGVNQFSAASTILGPTGPPE